MYDFGFFRQIFSERREEKDHGQIPYVFLKIYIFKDLCTNGFGIHDLRHI
jgi:hypothetical protein